MMLTTFPRFDRFDLDGFFMLDNAWAENANSFCSSEGAEFDHAAGVRMSLVFDGTEAILKLDAQVWRSSMLIGADRDSDNESCGVLLFKLGVKTGTEDEIERKARGKAVRANRFEATVRKTRQGRLNLPQSTPQLGPFVLEAERGIARSEEVLWRDWGIAKGDRNREGVSTEALRCCCKSFTTNKVNGYSKLFRRLYKPFS
jgi:hypothetical protein